MSDECVNRCEEEPRKGRRFHFEANAPDPKPPEVKVLDPDNPLLERFQKALKEHLLRQIDHLKEDIFEYECGIKKNNTRKDELGIFIYEEQQKVAKQQTIIEASAGKLETIQSAREEVENVLEEKRDLLKKERFNMLKIEGEELELRAEVEGMNLLISQMSKWEDSLESDITVKKRVMEKTRKDKKKLLEDKRLQDSLIYKLMTRIWHLESKLDNMDVQIKVKEQEREQLAQTAALGNTNIESIESEHRALMHSWNSVLVAIGNRDKVLNCLNKEIQLVNEKVKSVSGETNQIKKLAQDQMKRNQYLTMMKERYMLDIQAAQKSLDVELGKKNKVESKMREMQGIIDQTESDIRRVMEETSGSRNILNGFQRDLDILDAKKADIEEKIMVTLESETTSSKIINNLKRALKKVREQNRKMEIQLATMENRNAGVNSETETQKIANGEQQVYVLELEEKVGDLSKYADFMGEQIKNMDLTIGKRQREFDMLNMKLTKMEKTGVSTASSPIHHKIFTLEKNIEEVQEENKKLQQFWLREQTNLIRLSEERQEQIQNNNLLRKQITILEQKNLRVTDELDEHKRGEEKLGRSILTLQNKLKILSDNFCRKNKYRINLCKDNDVLQQDSIGKLKDAELECLRLQDEITAIEADKVLLSQELLDLNREVLEWEKKFLHAKELKSTMQDERSNTGEVGTMKAEIHRMQVRYSHLKKVQDVLVLDLEHCISRRDAIMTNAEAREKRIKGGMERTRVNFGRKLDDIRNKTKQMQDEIEQIVAKIRDFDAHKAEIEREIGNLESQIEEGQIGKVSLTNKVEEGKTQRQLNFELLLGLQKKLTIYSEVSKGRKPFIMYKSPDSIFREYEKQKNTNDKLVKIGENLVSHFPMYFHELMRILNTLKIPLIVCSGCSRCTCGD